MNTLFAIALVILALMIIQSLIRFEFLSLFGNTEIWSRITRGTIAFIFLYFLDLTWGISTGLSFCLMIAVILSIWATIEDGIDLDKVFHRLD